MSWAVALLTARVRVSVAFTRMAECLTPGRVSASGRLVQRKLPYTFLSNLESFYLRLVIVVQTVIGDGWHSHNLYINSSTIKNCKKK